MSHKLLVVSEQCPSCKTIKEHLKQRGVLEDYYVLDIATDEGQKLIDNLGIKAVPECVLIDDEKKQIRRCSDDEWMEMLEGE